MFREIIMEIELLYKKMWEVNKDIETVAGNKEMPFAKVIYAMTKGVEPQHLFNMNDEEFIRHIQKIQFKESL